MNSLLNAMSHLFPGYLPFVTSRGTAALYLALAATRVEYGEGEVIVPATICPSIPLTIYFAGLTPRFCDVELDTFCASPETISRSLSPNTKAIIVAYLFGKRIDIKSVMDIAQKNKLIVIEDLAQSIGGRIADTLLGSFGHFSVLSFNNVKILPGRFGMLLARDPDFLSTFDLIQQQMPGPIDLIRREELETGFRNVTHGFFDLLRSKEIDTAINFFPEFGHHFKKLFVYKENSSDNDFTAHVKAIKTLDDEMDKRNSFYEVYKSCFDNSIKYIHFDSDEMCWRLPILLDNHGQQLNLIKKIRAKKMLISNHYFPASHLFGDSWPENARQIGLRAVNCWVDGKLTKNQIFDFCEEVNRISQ